MTNKATVKDCHGCRDDFYNGHNNLGVTRCWNLASAMMESKLDIPVDLPPPYTHINPTSKPTCYKAKGYVRIAKDSLTKDGYWKR
jgi:hypothetical protein